MSNSFSYLFGKQNVVIEVGQCIIRQFNDGDYEVVQADPYAEFGEETMANPLFNQILVRDGAFIMVKGTNSFACYELIDQSYQEFIWIGKRVKYQLYQGDIDE